MLLFKLYCGTSKKGEGDQTDKLQNKQNQKLAKSQRKGALEKTYKPDSVPPRILSESGMIISLELELPRVSCDLPEDLGRASR